MDKLSVRSNKQGKAKKKPVKVVYISNPMKVKTSASDFRALVQELTGRNSDLAADMAKFSVDDADDDGVRRSVSDQTAVKVKNDRLLEVPGVDPFWRHSPTSSDSVFESFDDVFTTQMLENFTGYFPSGLVYESSQVDAA